MNRPTLALVYEPEAPCRARLLADGFLPQHAEEISSYLAQSTDILADFPALEAECAARGLHFLPVELDDAPAALGTLRGSPALVWTLSDGIAYFRGSLGPSLARLNGLATIGSDDSVFALCQDKFRSGAVLQALGLPVPPAGLARNGRFLAEPVASASGYFVKPNRLGSKVGIWPDSRCSTPDEALELSRRIYVAYRDDAVVQPYVPGRNARASFLAIDPQAGAEVLGIAFVDSGGDFQTMTDSLALYGDTGAAAKNEGRYAEPVLTPVDHSQPEAAATIRRIAVRMMSALGLRDVFSMDLRIEENGKVHLIEFEVSPGLPCFDFRAYCRDRWSLALAAAMAEAAARRVSAL
jgi:D-alanine-D-alanine ligase